MVQERNLGLPVLLVGLATSACVTALPATKPNDTYTTMNGPVVNARADEKAFLEDIQKELAKKGWEPATPGSHEMKAAQLVARAGFEQRWSSSGVTSSPPNASSEKPLKALLPTKAPRLPTGQYATAYGIPSDFASWIHTDDYSTTSVAHSDLEDMVRDTIHTRGYLGQPRLGVAILPDSADAHRIFTAVIRDEVAEISEGAPRIASPGATFSIKGTWVAKNLTTPELVVLEPDGKLAVSPLNPTEGGGFSASYTLPAAPGIYVVSLTAYDGYFTDTFYRVAVFSGLEPTPWPPRPPEGAPPPSDVRDAAGQIVQALENWRVRHGLPVLPVKADLCTWAKTEAQLLGTFEMKNLGGPYDYKALGSQSERLKTAGIDPDRTRTGNLTWGEDSFPYFLATFLETPQVVRRLTTPNAEALGIGAVVRTKDNPDEPTTYRMVWLVTRSAAAADATAGTESTPPATAPAPATPSETKAPETAQPPPSAAAPAEKAPAEPTPPAPAK
jgi:hypothetical protein